MSRKLRAKTLGGVVCVCAEPVEKGAVCVERLFDSGVEQLFLALEVVVERRLGHADLADHAIEPDGMEPVRVEQPVRRLNQLLSGRFRHFCPPSRLVRALTTSAPLS